MYFQGTIKKEVSFKGIGLHTGRESEIKLFPAPPDTGIVFVKINNQNEYGCRSIECFDSIEKILKNGTIIEAKTANITETNNALTIGKGQEKVKTIEHFMAAFYSLGITNLYVAVIGEEMPILDGSSKPIIKKIEKAGIVNQNSICTPVYLPYPLWVEQNGSYLIALPSSRLKVTYTIDFTNKSSAIGTQTAQFVINTDIFKKEIAPARTFGFYEDIEKLKKVNLAKGGSVNNALIFTKDGVINESLRFKDECVRHKILDLIGDMALLGRRVVAHFIAYKSGHTLDIEMVKKIEKSIRRTRHLHKVPSEVVRKKQREFNSFRKRINL